MAYVSMNFSPKSGRGLRLDYYDFSVNRKRTYHIVFSQSFTNTLREEGMKKADVMMDDQTGEVVLAFSADKGMKLVGKARGAQEAAEGANYHNLCLCNKAAVQFICDKAGIRGDYAVLQMSDNLSDEPGVRYHKIIGKKR